MNRFKLTNNRESKQIFQGIIFIVTVAMVMILLITEGVIT